MHLPSFLVFLFFLPPCSLPLSPPFVSIIDFTVFWDFSDSLKDRMEVGARALLLSSASLVVNILYTSAWMGQGRFQLVKTVLLYVHVCICDMDQNSDRITNRCTFWPLTADIKYNSLDSSLNEITLRKEFDHLYLRSSLKSSSNSKLLLRSFKAPFCSSSFL